MIKDKLINAELYYNLSDGIKNGLEWLKSNDLNEKSAGRYYLNGEEIFVNIDEYETKENGNYESHRKYIDIQYMIQGEEKIAVTDISNCKTCVEYDKEKDIEFFVAEDEFQILREGEFFIFYPQDAHKPCISLNNKKSCKKAVVKVRI